MSERESKGKENQDISDNRPEQPDTPSEDILSLNSLEEVTDEYGRSGYIDPKDGKKYRLREEGEIVEVANGSRFSRKETLTEAQIKREHVSLQIYRELGVNTPVSHLVNIDGKTGILIEVLSNTKKVHHSDIKDPLEVLHLKELHLASVLLNNPGYINNLRIDSDRRLTVEGSIISKIELLSRGRLYDFKQEFEGEKGITIIKSGETEERMREKIESLSPKKIIEIVLNSEMDMNETRDLLEEILDARENLINRLSPEEDRETLERENLFLLRKVDEVIKRQDENFRWQKIEKLILETSELIKGEIDEEEINTLYEQYKTIRTVELSQVINKGKRLEDVSSKQNILLSLERVLEDKKRESHKVLWGVSGIKKLEEEIIKFREEVNEDLSSLIGRNVYTINKCLEMGNNYISSKIKHEELFPLDTLPTSEQLDVVINFFKDLKGYQLSYETREDVSRTNKVIIPSIIWKRKTLILSIIEGNQSIAVHTTIPNLARKIFNSGFLKSPYSQKIEDGVVHTNSPVGQNAELPQLVFSVNQAVTQYGGDEKRESIERKMGYGKTLKKEYYNQIVNNSDRSIGFASPYTSLVRQSRFFQLSIELHVFDKDYDIRKEGADNNKGAKIDINELIFLIPEEKKDEWIRFLITEKEEGGAGLDEEWIKNHILIYPEHLSYRTFVRFFLKENLDKEKEEKHSIFLPEGEKVRFNSTFNSNYCETFRLIDLE